MAPTMLNHEGQPLTEAQAQQYAAFAAQYAAQIAANQQQHHISPELLQQHMQQMQALPQLGQMMAPEQSLGGQPQQDGHPGTFCSPGSPTDGLDLSWDVSVYCKAVGPGSMAMLRSWRELSNEPVKTSKTCPATHPRRLSRSQELEEPPRLTCPVALQASKRMTCNSLSSSRRKTSSSKTSSSSSSSRPSRKPSRPSRQPVPGSRA